MDTSPNESPHVGGDEIRYADEAARELLIGHLAALAEPWARGWERVRDTGVRAVYRGSIGGKTIFVKHFRARRLSQRLRRRLGVSEALRELANSRRLVSEGVPAVRALAAANGGGAEWVAPLGEGGVAGDRWLREQLGRGPAGQKAIAAAAEEVGRIVGKMHAAGFVNRDLRISNLLVRGETDDGGVRATLLDLHRARRRRVGLRRARMGNLARLFYESADCTTRTQRMRFLRAYAAELRPGARAKDIHEEIVRAAGKYRRRHLARLRPMPLKNGRYFAKIILEGGWMARVVLISRFCPQGSSAGGMAFSREDWRAALAEFGWHPRAGAVCPLGGGASEGAGAAFGANRVRRTLDVGGVRLGVIVERIQWRPRSWLAVRLRPSPAERAFVEAHAALAELSGRALLALAMVQRKVSEDVADGYVIYEDL